MKFVLLLLTVLLLNWGCTTTYNHPNKGALEFEQDRMDCEQAVRSAMLARGIEDC